jgi:CDP-diacylglycerol--glycerol-3-phosphate 3-phosphatidyltransferase
MKSLWDRIQAGYLRIIAPVADLLVRRRVSPNLITTVGTLCSMTGGVIYGTGHIRTAGWFLALTALFDVLDGTVARRTGRSTVFGAFYDSTLDRVADGFVLGGLTAFYAMNPVHKNVPMVIVGLLGVIGTFLVSYTRARAEALGLDAKVGVMQRPERVTLLSAPQALFGLALNGWVLLGIVVLLTVTGVDHRVPAHRLRLPGHARGRERGHHPGRRRRSPRGAPRPRGRARPRLTTQGDPT